MPDLGELIRVKLKEINEGAEYGNEQALGVLLDVAHAVMELHKPVHVGGYKGAKGWDHCSHCRDTNWGGPDVDWPCDTVEAVAKALGIEPS